MADEKTDESKRSHRSNSESNPATPEHGTQTSCSPPVRPDSTLAQNDVPHSPKGPAGDSQSVAEGNLSTNENTSVGSEASCGDQASPVISDPPDSPPQHQPFCPYHPPSDIPFDQIFFPFQGGNIVPQQTEEPQGAGGSTGPHSDYSDETASTTDTITSNNYTYHYENGRRYHGFGSDVAYLLPNDEQEQERLNRQHRMWLSAIGGKLHIAPLPDNIHEVLDVGTGTGVWAIDFADTHPSAEVTGTDISPIQPRLVPPNCRFIVDNSEDEWQWQNKFDFIHSRALASSWQDWESYFHKCYQALKPGGYLEVQEYMLPFEIDIPTPTVPTPSYAPSSTTPPNPVLEWSNYFAEACRLADVGLDQVPQLDILLQNAGFTSVTRKMVRQPINGWSEDPDERARGELYAQCFDYGLGVTMFTRRLGWSYAQAEVFLVDVRKAAKDEGNRVWVPFFFYTAKKPE